MRFGLKIENAERAGLVSCDLNPSAAMLMTLTDCRISRGDRTTVVKIRTWCWVATGSEFAVDIISAKRAPRISLNGAGA